jgi:hypothetical protein
LKLHELLDPYTTVSIIGICKNAGKTTTLNSLIREYGNRSIRLALTSVGRDGESVDVVTSTEKPEIFIREGTFFATTQKLLPLCDVTKEIVHTTGINTPLGQIVLVRSLSSGFIQLSGSSINSQTVSILEKFAGFGAQKILVDGAVSRKTMSSPAITQAAVLCASASLNRDMQKVVDETTHLAELLLLPRLEDGNARKEIESLRRQDNFISGEKVLKINENCYYIKGAVPDRTIGDLIMSSDLKGVKIAVDDASKLFIKRGTFEKLTIKQAELAVLSDINLTAVTINPYSVYGFSFDKDLFMEKMSEKIKVPVFNVKEDICAC